MRAESSILSDDVLESIRRAARNAKSHLELVDAIVSELLHADLDLHREPNLEQMKQLLVIACRERRDASPSIVESLQTAHR